MRNRIRIFNEIHIVTDFFEDTFPVNFIHKGKKEHFLIDFWTKLRMRINMDTAKLAELKSNDDGTTQFRLLSESFPKIKIGDIQITLIDLVFVFIQNSNGITSDVPEAKIEIQMGKKILKHSLMPQQAIQIDQSSLTFLYALDGEMPGLPKQSAAYFKLKPMSGGT